MTVMKEIDDNGKYVLTNKDRREEFIEAFEKKEKFISQVPEGKDVEDFDESYGFFMKEKIQKINLNMVRTKRAYAVAKLWSNYSTKLGLRESYYAMRDKADLIALMNIKADNLYQEILKRVNTVEILADVDRINFTISSDSNGYIYYPFSESYGNPKKKVMFSEELAVETLQSSELPNCKSVLVVEKKTATNRLIAMDFPKMINAALITVGGEYNRGIFRFVKRFEKDYPLLFFCDADVYGAKMISTVFFGSKRSRHLDLRTNLGLNTIHIAGLFPSVARDINLSNDLEEKRPLDNPFAKKMLSHIKEFNLVNKSDIETWNQNLTYELDALAVAFTNNNREPIGLGIYLIEFMREKKIDVKPIPNNVSYNEFKNELEDEIKENLIPELDIDFIGDATSQLENSLQVMIQEFLDEKETEVLNQANDEINDYIDSIDDKVLHKNLMIQYCRNIKRQKYSNWYLTSDIMTDVKTNINLDNLLVDEISKDINTAIKDLLDLIKPKIEKLFNEATVDYDLELENLDEDIELCNLYDKVLETIGAKEEDVLLIREALIKRLANSEEGKV